MAVAFSRWERRDGSDRAAMALAALGYCRAGKAAGVRARFYWTGADSIAVIAETENASVFDEAPSSEYAQALFALADLARETAQERWIDPRVGAAAYDAAGR